MWSTILSGLKTAGKFLGSDTGKKALEVGGGLLAAKLADKGAQKANALEAAVGGRDVLTTPMARRDAIVQDENIAGSMAQAGNLGNTMADRTANQALKMAILKGANMGGVSAPSFLAGKTGSVSGPMWTAEQIAALQDSYDSGNANVQRSIDALQSRKNDPFSKMVFGAAASENDRLSQLMPMIQQQAMESGIMGSAQEKSTPWWQKWLIPAAAGVAGAYGLGKLAKPPFGPESKLPGISNIADIGKKLPFEVVPSTNMIWNSKPKFGKIGWGGK